MKISARNQLKGKVVGVKTGATTAHVPVEIAGGQIVPIKNDRHARRRVTPCIRLWRTL